MAPLVEVIFDADQDFYHASSLYAGLDILARQRLIRLRLRHSTPAEKAWTADSLTICLNVWCPHVPDRSLRIAIDLHDQSDVFAAEILQHCDGYFKRSFHAPDVTALPAELAMKVRPFGLNYACRTFWSTVRLVRSTTLPLLRRGATGLRRLRHHYAWPTVADFEQPPTALVEPAIIFQTRVWEANETAPGESENINEGRVALIRALREAFGDRFRGGLVPSPLALARYPREIATLPSKRKQFTAMSRRNLIGIYTVGLHVSTAFKLPEYLAASQCVVAEPPRNELPVPLEPGVHFLPFHSPDECVAACQRLLADGEAASRMRRANADYYNAHVAPASRMYRVLNHSIDFGEQAGHLAATSAAELAVPGTTSGDGPMR